MPSPFRMLATLAAVVAAAQLVAGGASRESRSMAMAATPAPPNVIFVLTDDMSWDLVRFMPNLRRLQRDGTTFTRYYVTDSLCCPSRASILTGELPHNTGVLGNTPPLGGYGAFRAHHDERRTFAVALQQAGYRTGLMGKYLNRYDPHSRHVPPGWTSWAVPGWGYPEYHYTMNVDGRLKRYGDRPRSYLTSVLARRGLSFLDQAARDRRPFMLELATFAPHRPSTPAPRDLNAFPGLRAPRGGAYDRAVTDPPGWLRGRPPLDDFQRLAIDAEFRRRAQSLLAVDRMLGQLRRRLRALGLERRTYIVFSSDNGYHLGQHRLVAGKMTAFETDIRVPLVVAGPGVPAGRKIDALTENVDLAPTFMQLAGLRVPPHVDGRGLLPLLRGQRPPDWRDAVLVEHHRSSTPVGDPDVQPIEDGSPPDYEAVRLRDALYVEYVDGSREYYDTRSDPLELHNVYGSLDRPERQRLHRLVQRLARCHGSVSCRLAGQLP